MTNLYREAGLTCQCGSQRFTSILAYVPPRMRISLGIALQLGYSLCGSMIPLPMDLCLDCGRVAGDWPARDPKPADYICEEENPVRVFVDYGTGETSKWREKIR